ncbi:MAG: hypothetical protein AAGC85_24865, partial [Bacteroidota bacterium]
LRGAQMERANLRDAQMERANLLEAQVNETMKGFSKAYHIEIENAGHDQVLWNLETFDNTIPAFLKGETISSSKSYYSDIDFLPVKGKVKGHPSLE